MTYIRKTNKPYKSGEDHGNWKGEVKHGYYTRVVKPDHPNGGKKRCVMKHRLIYENYLSILFDEDVYIPKGVDVHHIIPIKNGGTNALINLELLTRNNHTKLHKTKNMNNRLCLICKSDKTYKDKFGYYHWHKYKDGFICERCYKKHSD